VHVDGDVVNGMAANQSVVLVRVLCGGMMKEKNGELYLNDRQ
jgi:hypothetical protein